MTYEEAASTLDRLAGPLLRLKWLDQQDERDTIRALDMGIAALREKHDAEQTAAFANPQNPEGWYPGRVGRG